MQYNYTRKREKGKHLTLAERGKIEALLKAGYTKKKIAQEIGVSERTIYREIKRGTVKQFNSDLTSKEVYCADAGARIYRENQSKKQGILKIGFNIKLSKYIEHLIVKKKYSPYAALEKAKEKYAVNFCLKTLYNYIHKNIFYKLNLKHLPYNKKYYRYKDSDKRIRKIGGKSIEERAKEIDYRQEVGHWEMDTVVGKRGTKACLLVLTERKTRKEIIIRLKDKTSDSVVKAFEMIKKRYPKTFNKRFKSITSDNGAEFMNAKAFEEMGISYFYAHSYCSYERGSNENNNKLIRRFIKKSADIGIYTDRYIREVEKFINSYPRKIFNGKSSEMMYRYYFRY